jgi:hypothetical protein
MVKLVFMFHFLSSQLYFYAKNYEITEFIFDCYREVKFTSLERSRIFRDVSKFSLFTHYSSKFILRKKNKKNIEHYAYCKFYS